MAKKAVKAPSKDFSDEFLYELCVLVYQDQLNTNNGRDGNESTKRHLKTYRLHYKGDKEKAVEMFRKNGQFYNSIVKVMLTNMKKLNALPKAAASDKLKFRADGSEVEVSLKINPDFLYELCVLTYKDMVKKDMMDELVKKYKGDKDRATKRFRDRAQLYAPVARSVLRGMKALGALSSKAEK